jgi:hypothetical protein
MGGSDDENGHSHGQGHHSSNNGNEVEVDGVDVDVGEGFELDMTDMVHDFGEGVGVDMRDFGVGVNDDLVGVGPAGVSHLGMIPKEELGLPGEPQRFRVALELMKSRFAHAYDAPIVCRAHDTPPPYFC